MSADNVKKNLGTILFVVVLLGVLAFALWRLQGAFSLQKAVAAELEGEQQRLTELQRQPVYPSQENLEMLRKNREIMQELYGGLHEAALRPLSIPKVDRVQFASLLGQKLSELNREARRSKVGLPEKFAFSFNEYLFTLPPENRVVLDTLTKHLLVVDQVSRLLFASGAASSNTVYSLGEVKREPVVAASDANGMPATEQLPDGRLFRRLPFEFKFSCSTAALQHFLNALARADWLFVVRSVNIDVRTVVGAVPVDGGAEPPAAPANRPATPPPGMGLLPPGGPGMAGPSGAGPGGAGPAATRRTEHSELDVVLKLELIEFPGATAEAKPAPEKP